MKQSHEGREPTTEEIHELARAIMCPRCGSGPYVACIGYHGQIKTRGYHAERLSVAVGGPASERRQSAVRRTPGQGRVDGTVEARRVDDAA
jgi:hypothetical protein